MTPVDKCLTSEHTLLETIVYMNEYKWNTLPVVNSANKLVGVFTRSILFQMLLSHESMDTPIGNYVKKDIGTISNHTTVEQLEEYIAVSEVGTGFVVNDEGVPIGLISKSAAVKSFLQKTRMLKEQLERILQNSNLGAFMADDAQRIIFINDNLEKMIGVPESTLLNKKVIDVFPDWIIPVGVNEVHFQEKIGSQTFMIRLSKFNMTNGKQGLIALFQNISELENMAQELATIKTLKSLLQTVIDHSYDGLVMINAVGKITFTSPSLLELFELQHNQTADIPIEEIFPQFELTKVLKTGVADISDFMEIKGINYLVYRIPVYQDEQIIGAIGKIVYRQLHEVRETFKRYERKEMGNIPAKKPAESSRFSFDEILSKDPQMEKLFKSGMKAAKGKTTILIRGESGTGKELFAHAIHSSSNRENAPFITVNCAAIPEHLLESEFFGYEEGAFTGAKQKGKSGKFDMANGGTLFLDEIGDMSLQLQAKLLRVLQEREFYRVGGTERITVDIRIIAATNRNLEEMVEKGEFREDLFYRLNVISFEIPPLRKRKGDILLLCKSFMEELNKQNGTSITGWDPLAEQALLEHDWPGNVRELRNVCERAMIFADNGMIHVEDLPDNLLKKIGFNLFLEEDESGMEKPLLERAEEMAIRAALKQADGNKSKACKLLGISRSVLYDKLKKYEVSDAI
ncbi:sigma-54-dependent Fis family transcriptional regulator [Bacillus benzoevorans]|uniref:Transcriptional regulator with PAS, ATPase and Fis domain n=1 Tax=Bacillus benzoevorans TaxID=1456 RepID=A0A7X0HVC0_9BACI|nr:sigma-54-dependent Fis family transcriptional regulator [Bacillus benzoevorans]MBB6446597.1 transcriptional regulator with PAS, ATPase and Fis domain [Bacillus benzoevorans]